MSEVARTTRFSLARLLIAIGLLNLACLLFSDLLLGTPRSLIDAPALLASVAAAFAALVGKMQHVCFVAAAVFVLLPLGVGGLWLLASLGLE